MTSQEKNSLKNDKYFNSVFAENDANDFSEISEGPISNVNLKLSEIIDEIINEELFNEIKKIQYCKIYKFI